MPLFAELNLSGEEDDAGEDLEAVADEVEPTHGFLGILGLFKLPRAIWKRITLNDSRTTKAAIAGRQLASS